jgi:DNA-binding transcriptional ArsR family regulator
MVDARLFQALSDRTRLEILSLLGKGAINVSGIVAYLGCAQPAVSRHLRVLREASLICDKRKGKEVEYSIIPGAFRAAAAYLENLSGNVRGERRPESGGDRVVEVVERKAETRAERAAEHKAARAAERKAGRGVELKAQLKAERRGQRGMGRKPSGRVSQKPLRPAKAEKPEVSAPSDFAADFASKEADFVVAPRKESGMDDFLL